MVGRAGVDPVFPGARCARVNAENVHTKIVIEKRNFE